MYTVDRIENNIIILIDRKTKEIKEIERTLVNLEVKEGDILELVNNNFIKNELINNEVKKDIRSRFDRLKK